MLCLCVFIICARIFNCNLYSLIINIYKLAAHFRLSFSPLFDVSVDFMVCLCLSDFMYLLYINSTVSRESNDSVSFFYQCYCFNHLNVEAAAAAAVSAIAAVNVIIRVARLASIIDRVAVTDIHKCLFNIHSSNA